MSIETQIAAFLEQAAQNIALPQEVRTAADAKIAEIGASFTARQASMQSTFYVDSAAGIDTNSGLTSAAPLKSVQRALALTAAGGECIVNLMNDLTIGWDANGNDIYVYNRAVRIQSSSAVQRNINFTAGSFVSGASTYRKIAGFTLYGRCKLDFFNVKLWMPDVANLGNNLASTQGSLIHVGATDMGGGHAIALSSTLIDAPATPYGPVIGVGAPAAPITLAIGTGVGVTNSGVIDGKWFEGVTMQVNANTLNWLRTNRTTV